ncbi:MAG: hypothetical protein IJ566_08500 [Cardiobacteriaceae bacterium]|nr:hypothetical protein [Cardiobacteriaceae bacterium]
MSNPNNAELVKYYELHMQYAELGKGFIMTTKGIKYENIKKILAIC